MTWAMDMCPRRNLFQDLAQRMNAKVGGFINEQDKMKYLCTIAYLT